MGRTFEARGWGDREVKVRKDELLEVLRANRERHVELYREACKGYRAAALKRIDEITQELRDQIHRLKEGEMVAIMGVSFGLAVPENHEAAYDQIIKMMEMSVDTEITLTAGQFSCFVMDDWEWKEQWTHSNAAYFGGMKAAWDKGPATGGSKPKGSR